MSVVANKKKTNNSQNKYRLAKTLYADCVKFILSLYSEELPDYSLYATKKSERQLVFSNDCITPVPVKVCKDRQVNNSLIIKYLGMSDPDRSQPLRIQPFHLFIIKFPEENLYNVQLCKSIFDKPSSEEFAVDAVKLKPEIDEENPEHLKPILEFLNLVLVARQ